MKLKRADKQRGSDALNYLFSIVLVLIIASVLILVQGSNPVEALSQIVIGSVGSVSAIASSIRWSIPVLIATMAAIVAHSSGISNLGLDGQVYFGAFASALVGAFIKAPHILHVAIALLAGALAGALYALVPALLKNYFKVNEMITTLMFNYIAILLTEFLTMKIMGFSTDSNPEMIATQEIADSAKLALILPPYQATTGIFIALAIVALVYILYRYTRTGYAWKLLGKNNTFARYSGIKTAKNFMVVFLLSGALAGLCGTVEILGPHLRFRSNFAANLGWDGIMVALIAKNKPLNGAVVAIIWGMIKAGSLSMERMTSVNRILVTLLQALFVLFITVDIRSLLVKKLGKNKPIPTRGKEAA